jgi:hypothetical protein
MVQNSVYTSRLVDTTNIDDPDEDVVCLALTPSPRPPKAQTGRV